MTVSREFTPRLALLTCACKVASVMSDSLEPYGLYPEAHQAPLSVGFSRQEYEACCCALLQGIFLTQGSNPCLYVSCIGRWIPYH